MSLVTPIPFSSSSLERTRLQLLSFFCVFLVCYASTQLAHPLQQTRIQEVRSNQVAQKRLTESNGTPAMDLGHMNVVLK